MRVRGGGPTPCDIAVVSEAPLLGKAADELNRYLNGRDIPTRSRLYITSLYREIKAKDEEYTAADLATDEPELLAELDRVRPTTIVPLGRDATRYFLGDVDMDETQGIPWLHERGVVLPIMHPAAGLHNPELSPYVVYGFGQLAAYLRGEIGPRHLFADEHPTPHYEEITNEQQLGRILQRAGHQRRVAIDTEGTPGKPWSLQFAFDPGTGYLISASAGRLLQTFSRFLRDARPVVIFHSALHDLASCREMGVDLEGVEFADTMVMSYLLQLEPQGLKALAVRHAGMAMRSYDEILGDAGTRLAAEHLMWMWDLLEARHEEARQAEFTRLVSTPYTNKAGKVVAGRKLKKAPQVPKTPLHKAVGRAPQSRDPRGLWDKQVDDIQVAGYRLMGPMPEPTLDYVERADAVNYGCRDADGTLRVAAELGRRVRAMGLSATEQLEYGTYPLIDRMHHVGIKADLAHFARLSIRLDEEITVLRERLIHDTGRTDFNANSGDQVADYLFDTLGLKGIKRTESGRYSTNDKILEALEREHAEHPVIHTIREYRETYKLKNTFVDRLPDFTNRYPHDGRVHATFRTTRVVTGRLAASDPNVLAQPEHGKFAKDFKRGWVAEDGHILLQWDESQVELRGLAHLSNDPVLLAVYRGEQRNPDGSLIDLHARLAQRIFGGDITQYMSKCAGRLAAKAINFGIPMGMTAHGLSVELRKNGVEADERTAQQWLDETLALYTGVRLYMEQRIAEARSKGFIRCLSGRVRYIGGIRSRDERVRAEAERFAFSTPIQESATYIMKQAENTVWQHVLVPHWKRGDWVEPILQVHDCLKLEADERLAQELNAEMVAAMTVVPHGFSVPLAVEGEWGYNMADMRGF